MNKFIIAALGILAPVCILAQTYQPFPLNQTSEWRAQSSILMPPCWDTYWLNYHISGLLTQSGKEYQIIAFNGIYHSQAASPNENPSCSNSFVDTSGIAGLMRAEEGKYYIAQVGVEGEQLYLDFTLTPGDTLWDLGQFPFVVDSADMVDVNGRSCIRQWFCADEFDTECNNLWAIEGIGHSYGFLNSLYHFESGGSFMCYRENHIQVYPVGAESCIILSEDTAPISSGFRVYPNPTDGIVRIDANTPCQYQVSDALGRSIFSGSTDNSVEIDFSRYPKGIYTIVLTEKGRVRSARAVRQ
jgi:hypothetical protein